MKMERTGHGCLNEIDEKEFLPEVTTTKHVVAHFYHQEFERCRIMDKHLAVMAKKYFETKFVKISAPDAPFFVTKLQVKVLPCLIYFRDGVASTVSSVSRSSEVKMIIRRPSWSAHYSTQVSSRRSRRTIAIARMRWTRCGEKPRLA